MTALRRLLGASPTHRNRGAHQLGVVLGAFSQFCGGFRLRNSFIEVWPRRFLSAWHAGQMSKRLQLSSGFPGLQGFDGIASSAACFLLSAMRRSIPPRQIFHICNHSTCPMSEISDAGVTRSITYSFLMSLRPDTIIQKWKLNRSS